MHHHSHCVWVSDSYLFKTFSKAFQNLFIKYAVQLRRRNDDDDDAPKDRRCRPSRNAGSHTSRKRERGAGKSQRPAQGQQASDRRLLAAGSLSAACVCVCVCVLSPIGRESRIGGTPPTLRQHRLGHTSTTHKQEKRGGGA